MKKIITYILISIIISILSGQIFAYSETHNQTHSNNTERILLATDNDNNKNDYIIPKIPKPSTLPGPSEEQIYGEEGKDTGAGIIFLSQGLLPKFTVGMIGFIGGLSLFFLIVGGVRYATMYGNEEAIEKAKNQVIYALVGFIIALLAYTIVTIIINIELA